ncbi:hypothetical protein, partial [Roseovarius sp. SYSU LYC5161]|uniref:hypothetical protein n=1 Tax=Roseovarius halophilus (ex Wu et al. 2025) TaxID=3376060 RepID=UPI00399BF874
MAQPGHDDTPVLVLKLCGRPAVLSGHGTRVRFPTRKALRGTLHEMRRALGAEADRLLRQTRERVALDPDLITTDAGDPDAAPAAPQDPATDFLVGLEIGTPGFDQWCA